MCLDTPTHTKLSCKSFSTPTKMQRSLAYVSLAPLRRTLFCRTLSAFSQTAALDEEAISTPKPFSEIPGMAS